VEKWIDQYEHPEKYPKQVIVEEAEVVEETPVES
jgi:hypothetical protein